MDSVSTNLVARYSFDFTSQYPQLLSSIQVIRSKEELKNISRVHLRLVSDKKTTMLTNGCPYCKSTFGYIAIMVFRAKAGKRVKKFHHLYGHEEIIRLQIIIFTNNVPVMQSSEHARTQTMAALAFMATLAMSTGGDDDCRSRPPWPPPAVRSTQLDRGSWTIMQTMNRAVFFLKI